MTLLSWVPVLRTEPPPDEVRDAMRDIFERSEFERSKSILERIAEWIERHLGGSSGASTGGWGGSIASIVGWVAIALLVIGLVVIVVYVVRNRVARVRTPKRAPVADAVIEEHRSAREWAGDAEAAERDGRWKDAVRARYRELVMRLADRQVVSSVPGRTTGELRTDVRTAAPEVADLFDDATLLFELPWYAGVPTGPEETAELRRLASRILEPTS